MAEALKLDPPSSVGLPLGTIRAGRTVRLVTVRAAKQLRARLAAMGLLPGAKVTMVRNTGGGPIVVAVHNTRLALGRNVSHHLLVAEQSKSK